MNFAFCPSDGPPVRLIRMVPPSAMPADHVVALLDETNNVLRIDSEVFPLLDPLEQHLLVRTLAPVTTMRDVNFGR